jgi:RNA polymerase sigma factor (sigma-70 family)
MRGRVPDIHKVMLQRGSEDGPTARFERLYREHSPAVIAYAARRVQPDFVADVAAETFAVAWRRLDRVPAEARPWLLGVARRVIANHRRSLRRRAALLARAAEAPPPVAPAHGDGSRLLTALSELSERDRETLRLAAWEELSAEEAAQVLDCTVTAYRLRLHRARRKLARQLGRSEGAPVQESAHPVLRPEEHP